MVRRWSYLNQLNIVSFGSSTIIPSAKHDVTVKHNLYFKKNYSHVSLVSRRAWIKRRRLNNFSLYRNVLADWSSEYIFYRKYLKITLSWGLFKASAWSQNLILSKNTNPATCPNLEHVTMATVIRSVIKYCSSRGSVSFTQLAPYSNTLWLYLTSPSLASILKAQSKTTFWPMYRIASSSFAPAKQSVTASGVYAQLHNTVAHLILVKVKELYRVLTLVALLNTL